MSDVAAPPLRAVGDVELAAKVLRAEPGALERMMRANNRRLFRAARGILRNDADAEDAVQDGYVSAYRALGDFKGESSLATWLTRIVINKSLERLRQRSRSGMPEDPAMHDEKPVPPAETPEALAMRRELRRVIEGSIDHLPDGCRAVFMLRAVEEMSVAETAACLDMSEAAVKTALFRARHLLREAIGREIGPTIDEFFSFDGARCDRLVEAVHRRLQVALEQAPPPG